MSSAQNNQTDNQTVVPSTEIDGLKVKEAVNATLNTSPVVDTTSSVKAPASPNLTTDNSSVIKSSPSKIVKKKVTRCYHCKKKAGVAALKCKCGETFCSLHRMPEEHSCTFDFKTNDRAKLSQRLEKVVSSKLLKI
jgi:predicted nucleic acid binding AN1-type Zn finger protein